MKKETQKKPKNIFVFSLLLTVLLGIGVFNPKTVKSEENYSAEIVWSEYDGINYQIFQSSLRNGQWTIKTKLSEGNTINATPVIDSGDDGTIWVIWSSSKGANSDLYFSCFKEKAWSKPEKIPTQLSLNTSPSIIVTDNNVPWIVWAGFDGQDDDIFLSRWNGASWETPSRVNRNDTDPDIVPTIWKNPGGSICVRWSGYTKKAYRNYVAEYTGEEWNEEREETDGEYRSIMENLARVMPDLPGFVKNPELVAVHLEVNGEKNAFRFRDMIDENKERTLSQTTETSEQTLAGEAIIIGFGDSITQGVPYVDHYGEGRRVGGYEPHLEELTQTSGWQTLVLNYGVGGESTLSGLKRIESVLSRYSAKYVLILEGTNDLEWYGISRASTLHHLDAMVDISRQYNVIPVLATLTPDTKNSRKDIPTVYNPEIVRLASEKKVPLADQYAATAPNWHSLTYDGLHPNDAGYRVIASEWFDALPELTAKTLDATDVAESSVVFNGSVNPKGYPTRCYFEYGYNANFGGQTAVVDIGPEKTDVHVSIGAESLSENSTYYFRLVASNDYLTVKGDTLAFQTLESPSHRCFIATAAFGSSLESHVITLKNFRDKFMMTNNLGKRFVHFYYRHSPPLANYIAKHETLKVLIRGALLPVIGVCALVLNFPFWIVIGLGGLFFFVVSGVVVTFSAKRRRM